MSYLHYSLGKEKLQGYYQFLRVQRVQKRMILRQNLQNCQFEEKLTLLRHRLH
jgi:hypothetical protein